MHILNNNEFLNNLDLGAFFMMPELPLYKRTAIKNDFIYNIELSIEGRGKMLQEFEQSLLKIVPVKKEVEKPMPNLWSGLENPNPFLEKRPPLTARETNFDGRPYLDDCAEFFVVPIADSVYMHFGFEVNITKAAYDYIVLWKYYNNRTFFISGYNPTYKVESTYDGTINNDKDKDKGWKMEFQIPFAALSNFHIFNRPAPSVKWAFQAVRQDRNLVNDRFRSTSTLFPIYDIRLDVHQPARFGLLEIAD